MLSTLDKLVEMTRVLKSISAENAHCEQKHSFESLAKEVHGQEKVVTQRLLSVAEADRPANDIVRLPYRLERIGDMLETVFASFENRKASGVRFSPQSEAELDTLFSAVLDVMVHLRHALATSDVHALESAISEDTRLSETLACYRLAHWERLWSGSCLPQASAIYLAILDSIKWTNEYLKKICVTLRNEATA